MFDDFEPFSIKTQDDPPVFIRGVRSPSSRASALPPLLLLHGFPQTFHMWHRVAPLLSAYHLVLPDLRGYGSSSKPAHDASQYARSVIARDLVRVMDGLGLGGAMYVCGHDRGARAAHKLMVDFPARVRKALLLDICPTLAMYSSTNPGFARAYFHWFLLIQPEPLPETLLLGDPRGTAALMLANRKIAGGGGGEADLFDARALAHYTPWFADRETVHGWCQDYRASATADLDEARADLEAGRRIKCPIRVLLGGRNAVWSMFDARKEWEDVADEGVDVDVRTVDAGHFLAEELAGELVEHCLEFFVEVP